MRISLERLDEIRKETLQKTIKIVRSAD